MNEFDTLYLQDEKFNSAESREMELLIRLAPKRIAYALIHKKDNRLMVLYDAPMQQPGFEDAFDDLLKINSYLKLPFASVKVAIETLNFTLIPSLYFTKDDLPSYEKLVQAHDETRTFVSTLNGDAVKCVIALEMEDTAPFISLFSQVKLLSQVNSIVEGGMSIASVDSAKLVLQFNTHSFEVSYSLDNKLVFYNLFYTSAIEDFNYYLLMLIEKLSLSSAKTSVYLAGDISQGDGYHTFLKKHFSRIAFADCSGLVSLQDGFKKIDRHKYFSLLSLKVCE